MKNKVTTTGLLLALISLLGACSHPIQIEGDGDVVSNHGRSCTLEESRLEPVPDNCAKNLVMDDYFDTYVATPRAGWKFDHWRNYCNDAADNTCTFNIPAEMVRYGLFQTAPPLVAVFTPIDAANAEDGADTSDGGVSGDGSADGGSLVSGPSGDGSSDGGSTSGGSAGGGSSGSGSSGGGSSGSGSSGGGSSGGSSSGSGSSGGGSAGGGATSDGSSGGDSSGSGSTSAVVAATGQTACYDGGANAISCSGTGQDGDVQAGIKSPSPRFTDNGNGTVRDNLTGLIWLKRGKCLSSDEKVSWTDALNLAAALADGHADCQLSDGSEAGDWRLPNVRELMSLVDVASSRTSGPALPQGHPFTNVMIEMHWTSTSRADSEEKAWTGSFFYSGRFSSAEKSSDKWWVWAMRTDAETDASPLSLAATNQTQCYDSDGDSINCAGTGQDGEIRAGVPSPAQRFTDNGDGTVRDNLTGLVWMKKANCMESVDYADALRDVAALADGNSACNLADGSEAGDWRIPNYFEFLSLHDLSQFEPQLTPGHPFSSIQNELYWTSTTPARGLDSAWKMNSYWRNIHSGSKNSYHRSWPVRDGR